MACLHKAHFAKLLRGHDDFTILQLLIRPQASYAVFTQMLFAVLLLYLTESLRKHAAEKVMANENKQLPNLDKSNGMLKFNLEFGTLIAKE